MKNGLVPGVKAEWHKATDVLVSTPGYELFYGVIHPQAASFEDSFDPFLAIEEHKEFRNILVQEGLNVINLSDVLLSDHNILRSLAEISLEYVYLSDDGKHQIKSESYPIKQEVLDKLPDEVLLNLVLGKTQVCQIVDKEMPSHYHPFGYRVFPVTNHYFQRDPQITTDKGVVIGRMKNEVRFAENDIAEIIFNILGVTPVYRIKAPGTLEGGDYIPAGDFALIGEGLRTNNLAIKQILENKVLGFPEIAVVHDPYKQSDEMHLDTYLEFVGEKKAIIIGDRINQNGQKANPTKIPFVTIYNLDCNGNYVQQNDIEDKLSLQDYLVSKGVQLIPISKELQLNYGLNILTLSDRRIISVKGVSDGYNSLLQKNDIDFVEVDITNLAKGYGGPHCMTQVLKRGLE
jgi:arginine deiminase